MLSKIGYFDILEKKLDLNVIEMNEVKLFRNVSRV